jgi:hypothetical protein
MASYRKVKKEARKAQRRSELDPGPMFQKWRKATGMSKRGKKRNAPLLSAVRKNGKPAKRNTSVKMSLHDLRRLISGAKSGKRVKVKARVR